MRKVTREVATAFLAHKRKANGATQSDGTRYSLHGNVIAEWRAGATGLELWVTTAGWNTVTTRERLNGIGAQVHTAKGKLHLNGAHWDGDWIKLAR